MTSHDHEHIGPFQVLLVILSIYVLAALGVEAVVPVSSATKSILGAIDSAICVLFLADFFHRLVRAPKKLAFMKWGWIDAVSSVPAFPMFRWGRLVRVVRVIRLLRGVRSAKTLLEFCFESRAKGTMLSVVLACVVLLTFSSIAILHVETDQDSNIRTAGDALWWAIGTMTTVAYGDRVPTTAEGRMLGVLLMTAGVALFGVVTGYISSWFAEQNESAADVTHLRREIALLTEEVRALREQITASGTHDRSTGAARGC